MDESASTRVLRVITSVTSLTAALTFYRDVLGLALQYHRGDFASLRAADGVELLLHQRPAVPSDTAVSVGFAVADLDAVVRQWQAQHGTVVDPPARQAWGERMAVVRDPDGHLVCCSQA